MSFATAGGLAILLSVALLLYIMPSLTRPELFFGVTVPHGFRESRAGRGLTRIYRGLVWVLTAVGLAVLLAGHGRNPGVVLGAALWWLAVGGAFCWYGMNRLAQRHAVRPTAEREAALTSPREKLPGNWLVKLGPFLMLLGAMLYLQERYAGLPDSYPVHWNFRGVADRFVEKTPNVVFRLPVMGLVICGILAVTAFSLSRQSKRISIRGAAGERESRFRTMNLKVLLGAQYYIASIFAWIAVTFRAPDAMPFARYVLFAMSVLPLPLPLYLSIRYGQGGSRLADVSTTTLDLGEGVAPEAAGALIGDRTPDDCWKWGQLYFNPDDAAIWVEKRAGVGYTLNFAQPLAWFLLLAMLLGPPLVVFLMRG